MQHLPPGSLARRRSGQRALGHLLASHARPHARLLLPRQERQHQGPGRRGGRSQDPVPPRGRARRQRRSVLPISCTTCQVRHLCYSHYCQDSYTGDRAWRCMHMLRMRMEYGNMLQKFDCNLQHLWHCTRCKVRNSCYLQCFQDSYTGDRAWQHVHIWRMWTEYAMKS